MFVSFHQRFSTLREQIFKRNNTLIIYNDLHLQILRRMTLRNIEKTANEIGDLFFHVKCCFSCLALYQKFERVLYEQ